ncbi:MAG: DUF4388 domain-containing protein [Candidatus Dormibacteraeota bacterium]|nr:DUF4388 domain-containing protein [Candidatus Dormibacteraeota bacterium]
MQTQGSLSDGGLGALLETMQAERATGTLAIQNGSDSCSLYFLFGHLFHASGPSGQGEEVVVNALGWHEGSFQFDPRAKLPAEETIKSSPAELIAAADARSAAHGTPYPGESSYYTPSTSTEPDRRPAFEPYVGSPVPSTPEPDYAGAGSGLASWAATQDSAVEAPPPEPVTYSAPEPEAPVKPALTPAPLTPKTFPTPAPYSSSSSPSTYTPPADRSYSPPADRNYTPAPAAASTPSMAAGAYDAVTGPVFYPLPAGRPHYEGLKSAFVDFPRLLRTLRNDRHTGYVRLSGGTAHYSGFILLHEGRVLEALCSNTEVTQGETAFLHLRRHMDDGDGVIDVVELDGTIVDALARLNTGRPLFVGLLGRFVNVDALLEYLHEERLDGSVIVSTNDGLAIVLLSEGGVLGSYTDTQRRLDQTTGPAAALARDKSSRIDVKGPPTKMAALDVEGALDLPY